jgi:hypothetical protein
LEHLTRPQSLTSPHCFPITVQAIKNRIVRQENGINPRRDSRASTDHEDDDEDELEEEEEEEEEEEDEGGGIRVSTHHCTVTILILRVKQKYWIMSSSCWPHIYIEPMVTNDCLDSLVAIPIKCTRTYF